MHRKNGKKELVRHVVPTASAICEHSRPKPYGNP
jgi:hypothetical protein